MNRVDSPVLRNQKSINDSTTVSDSGIHGEIPHYVQFYESDAFLVTRVVEFFTSAFETEDSVIIIATPDHRSAVEHQLSKQGFSLVELSRAGRYFSIDAKEMLSRFMVAD